MRQGQPRGSQVGVALTHDTRHYSTRRLWCRKITRLLVSLGSHAITVKQTGCLGTLMLHCKSIPNTEHMRGYVKSTVGVI
ncbi:hypothetical protein E2C01_100156 [Portunus trituberculatus]|uniref:Uncharacterized protein n=1 Tax=Portunus trituberculatus TaxID=210409 RepID=A0A5B7KIN6_PORTR|nr:hypothetical protein [Portunus trituberculatus]